MPKDEFDFNDPMELSGVALATAEDTTDAMAECFIEEFLRLGASAAQVLALFRDPQYLGPHLVLRRRGELFVRQAILDTFALWGRPVPAGALEDEAASSPRPSAAGPRAAATPAMPQRVEFDATRTDPTGSPIPTVNP